MTRLTALFMIRRANSPPYSAPFVSCIFPRSRTITVFVFVAAGVDRMLSAELRKTVPFPLDRPVPVGSPPLLLLDRLTELCCPAFIKRQVIQCGPLHVTWDIPYRSGHRHTPRWAWAVYDRYPQGSLWPDLLTVDALDFCLVFSATGALVRARLGTRYLSVSDRVLFYEYMRLRECGHVPEPEELASLVVANNG